MNILDIIVLVFLVLFALVGFWKGFLSSLLSLFSSALSFVASFFLAKPLASLMNNWFGLGGTFANSVSTQISGFFSEFSASSGSQIMAENFSETGILKTAINFFVNPETIYVDKADVVNQVSKSAGNLILMAICLIISFVLIKIIIALLSKLFKFVKKKSSTISVLDRVLGFLFGLLKGAVIVFAVFVVANLIQSIPAVANFLNTTFKSSSIAKPIYEFVNKIVSTYLTNINFNNLFAKL